MTGIVFTAENAVSTARKIVRLRDADMEKITALNRSTEKGIKLLNSLYKSPLVRVKDVEKITGLKNPNALVLIAKFTSLGILKEMTGRKRNRVFAYQNYIKLFD